MKPRVKDIRDLALIAAVTAAVFFAIASWGFAAPACRPVRSVRHVSHVSHYHEPYRSPNVLYLVGQGLRDAAVDTYAHKVDGSYQALVEEVNEHRAWRAGFEAARGLAPQQAQETPPAAEPPQPGAQPGPPSAPVDRYATLKANCAKCHSGDEPKGGIWLDGSVPLDGPDKADTRDAIVRQIWNGHMPPKTPLDDIAITTIINELYAEE